MEKKSFEIWVNTEWLEKQQHQIKNETILFLQGKIVKTAQENDTLNSYLISYIIKLNSKVVDWQGSDQFPQKKNETDQVEDLALIYDHPVLQISRYTDWLK